MIVYKIKDSKIVGISRKDENYQIKEGEYQSNTWYQKPFFNGTEVVESITQTQIDKKEAKEEKEVIVKDLFADKVVLHRGFTKDGLIEFAVVVGNDAKIVTVIL